MKLYILTSTLNLHSIFATESCSPLDCYKIRGFGDKYFYPAGSFSKKNSIVLFDKYPFCQITHTDEEQYSLVIEIETEKSANFVFDKICDKEGIGIYQTSQTIYLNPIGCKLIFTTAAIKDMLLARAKVRSLDAKSVYYERMSSCVSLETYHVESFNYSKDFVQIDDTEFDEQNLRRDQLLNKCKGFLYAYIIGANLSPGENISKLYKILKEIGNIVHARIVNNDTHSNSLQLQTLTDEFNQLVHKFDPIHSRLSACASRLNGSSVGQFIEELKNLNVWNIIQSRLFQLPNLQNIYTLDFWEDLESRTYRYLKLQNATKLFMDEIPSIADFVPVTLGSTLSDSDEHLLIEWLKIFISPDCTLSTFYANKSQYLKSAGIKTRDLMGAETFEHSAERTYYNSLIKNIKEAESFDLLSINSAIWRSLAICAKANNKEAEALESLMVTYGLPDYRFAFAIWGSMCGYADMPKTFFNRLQDNMSVKDSFTYVSSVYKKLNALDCGEVDTALFTEFLSPDYSKLKEPQPYTTSGGYNKITEGNFDASDLSRNPIGASIIKNINKIEPSIKKQSSVLEAVSHAVDLEDEVQSPKAFMYILDSFANIKRTNAYKNLVQAKFGEDTNVYTPIQFRQKIYQIIGPKAIKHYRDKIDNAIALEAKRQDPTAFLNILDNFMRPTEPAYQRIAHLVQNINLFDTNTNEGGTYSDYTTVQLNKERVQRPINPTSLLFIEDLNAKNFIESCSNIPEDFRRKVAEQVDRLQKQYAIGGKCYGNPQQHPTDNKSTLMHLKNWCFYTKGKFAPTLENTVENNKLFDYLINDLKNHYGDR